MLTDTEMNTLDETFKELEMNDAKRRALADVPDDGPVPWASIQGKTTYRIDKKTGKVDEFRHGYRTNGPKKTRLINLVNQQMVELGAKGVHIQTLFKLLGMKQIDSLHTTTKQWSGVLGRIKKCSQENAD